VLVLGERFPYPRAPILVGLAVGCAALLAYANPTLRRITGFERLLARLPFAATLRQIDDALVIAARSPRELAWASGFSLFNQCCVMGALIVLGRSFGEQGLEVANYVVVSAVGNLISAVPLTPGGVGVTETAYGQLFELQGGSLAPVPRRGWPRRRLVPSHARRQALRRRTRAASSARNGLPLIP
jgi:uncharacterized membrane protein YbhN (UPF0104 family)